MLEFIAMNSINIIMYAICGAPIVYVGALLIKSILGGRK